MIRLMLNPILPASKACLNMGRDCSGNTQAHSFSFNKVDDTLKRMGMANTSGFFGACSFLTERQIPNLIYVPAALTVLAVVSGVFYLASGSVLARHYFKMLICRVQNMRMKCCFGWGRLPQIFHLKPKKM